MSWIKNIFGSSKGEASGGGGSARSKSSSPPPNVAQTQKEASQQIQALQEQIDTMQRKIDYNQLKLNEEEEKIKAIFRECGTDEKKKERKKAELMRHHQALTRFKTVIAQEAAKQGNLETLRDKVTEVLSNRMHQSALEGATKFVKNNAVDVERVDQIYEDVQTVISDQKEVSEIFARPLDPESVIDEDEFEKEMNALQEISLQEVPFAPLNSSTILSPIICPRLLKRKLRCRSSLRCSNLLGKNKFPKPSSRTTPKMSWKSIIFLC
jgi:hypothetical protein